MNTCQAFSKGAALIDDNKCGEPVLKGKSYCAMHDEQYHRTPNKSANDAKDYIQNMSR